MARPKLSDEDRRTNDVCVALNQKEFEKISNRAKLSKKTVSAYLRHAGMNDSVLKVVPQINRESASALREMQNLLSQFVGLLQHNQIKILDPIFFIEMQKELKQMHSDFLNYGDDEDHKG